MIYLDHNATSPMLNEVIEAMMPWFGQPANPASSHRMGQAAAIAVDTARVQVARLVGGRPEGVVFTSGATEANHLFIRGQLPNLKETGRGYAHSHIEHPCVLAASKYLASNGVPITTLEVKKDGIIYLPKPDPNLGLMSLMAANHETGVVQDLDTARAFAQASGCALHVDATQAVGRITLELPDVDGIVFSSHKLGGPGGVGALVLRDGEPYPPLLSGGSQERGRRAGTVFTAGVVGFGIACALASELLTERHSRWVALRETLLGGLASLEGQVVGKHTVANTVNVVFPTYEAESLVQGMDLRGVCISAGAACSSGSLQVSPVLTAMGVEGAQGAIRISMGPRTTAEDIELALTHLKETIQGLQSTMDFDS